MTPLLLFLPLCVVFAGEQDCTWQWEQIPTENFGHDIIAYAYPPEKTVYFSLTVLDSTIPHEIRHVKCFLQWEIDNEDAIRDNCNARIDDDYNVKKARPLEPPTPHTLEAIQEYHRTNTDDFWRYM